ncbi:MAG: hypothetical protein ACKOTA_03015 [Solirubrobacterales bacterium]
MATILRKRCPAAAGLLASIAATLALALPATANAEVKAWPGEGPVIVRDKPEVNKLEADEMIQYIFDSPGRFITIRWDSDEIFPDDGYWYKGSGGNATVRLSTSSSLVEGVLDPRFVVAEDDCGPSAEEGAQWKYYCYLSIRREDRSKLPNKSQRYPGRPYFLQLFRPNGIGEAPENATSVFILREGKLELPVSPRKAKGAAITWAARKKISNAKITCARSQEGDMFCTVIGTRRGRPVTFTLGVYRSSNLAVRVTPI